ncbi:alpha/beta hydrolase [Rhodococcoides trifolii]|uniref:alpha/beta hydrolase n=1 Tax=Rhodococcoides trifolii TaxID=908250 RepID=UPI00353003E0
MSLISGWLPVVAAVLGVLGVLWLVAVRSRRHVAVTVPLCAVSAAVVTVAAWYVVEKVWRPFPDPIETVIYVWIGTGLFALFVLVPRLLRSRGWVGRIVTVLAVVAVVLTASLHVNAKFDAYPTLGTVIGVSDENATAFSDIPGFQGDPVTGDPLDTVWTPPQGQPSAGRVTSVAIPNTQSGFTAREAKIYLPPAYFANPRPLLPFMVLLAGQPGSPDDWFNGGKLAETMDTFAAAHAGLSPIVIVADGTGSEVANPLCVDSPLGNVATYLAKDVPAWAVANLQIDTNPKHWAIGGLSYGGTCSLQMATNYPDVYPTFLDLSGQLEPTLGDRQRTLDAAFGGDEKAFEAVNPVDLMKAKKYPDTAGVFVVGANDNDYRPGVMTLYADAQAAGMNVKYLELPGAHSFEVWSAGLIQQLEWLSQRMGILS